MKSTITFDTYKGAEPFIFVSYAHKDRDSVFPLILELRRQALCGCSVRPVMRRAC
jgi:hypothetical protein